MKIYFLFPEGCVTMCIKVRKETGNICKEYIILAV